MSGTNNDRKVHVKYFMTVKLYMYIEYDSNEGYFSDTL